MFCRDLIYDWWTRDSKQQNGEAPATEGREPDLEPGRIKHDATAQLPQHSSSAESSVPEKRESDEHQLRPPSFSYPPTIIPPSQSDVKLHESPSAVVPNKPETTLSLPPVDESKIKFPRSASPDNVDETPMYTDTRGTLYGLFQQLGVFWNWLPFPTVKTVLSHLPFALIPFAFCMFIIVEGLVTKGWVEILAKGWAIWANKSNAAVAIAGMGFVSVCMCNVSDPSPYFFSFLMHFVPQFAGTNIGATILLSRVLQSWLSEHTPSERMVHGTVR